MNASIFELNSKVNDTGKILIADDSAFGIGKCRFSWISYDNKAEKGNKRKIIIKGYVDIDDIIKWLCDIEMGIFAKKYNASKKENGFYKPIYEINGGSIGDIVKARKIEVVKDAYKERVVFKVTEGPGKTTSTGGIVFNKQENIPNQVAYSEFSPYMLKKILLFYQSYITSCYLNENPFPKLSFDELLVNSNLKGSDLINEMNIFKNLEYNGNNAILLRYFYGNNQNKVEKSLKIVYDKNTKSIINKIRKRGDIVSYNNAS